MSDNLQPTVELLQTDDIRPRLTDHAQHAVRTVASLLIVEYISFGRPYP